MTLFHRCCADERVGPNQSSYRCCICCYHTVTLEVINHSRTGDVAGWRHKPSMASPSRENLRRGSR